MNTNRSLVSVLFITTCMMFAVGATIQVDAVEEVDWDAVLNHHKGLDTHRGEGSNHDHRHHDGEHDHSDDVDGDDERVGTAQQPLTGHHCIHNDVRVRDIPVGSVAYGVDVEQALVDTHSKRGVPDFRHLQAMLTDRHQRKGKGSFAADDDRIPTPTAFPQHQVTHEFMEMAADGSMKRLRAEQAVSYSGTTFSNIRIKYFFNVDGNGQCTTVGQNVTTYRGSNTTCTASDILTDAKKTYIINRLMSSGTDYLMRALNVVPVVGNLTVPGTRCGSTPGITVPEVHRTVGVDNVDFILYVTANPLGSNASTVAFASTCFSDQNRRPIVGSINFVPASLGNAATLKVSQTNLDINTAIHEACHALGYSSFFSFGYVNLNGVRVSGGTTSAYDSTLQKTTTKMVTPRVLAAARAYFNCSTLDGVEIEDQGGAGTQGVHWEKRILAQEFIAGILTGAVTYVSSLTLAYFEDTGHYTANYEYSEDASMLFYKNSGCALLGEKCNSAANQASGEFCFDTNAATKYCTNDLTSGGYCNVRSYSTGVPAAYRYFSDLTLGSRVILDDYCPTVLPFSNQMCIEATNVDSQDIYGNSYNPASRCFVSNLVSSDFSPGSEQDVRCFPYSCSIVTGSLLLNIRGQTARCPVDRSAGYADLSQVTGYVGVIKCPAASVFCAAINGPTPAPTPAPPTPVPTPAPPGFTAAPAPVAHSTKLWYNANMPANCVNRTACAANLASLFPACRLIATRLSDCFGTNCQAEMMAWAANASFTAMCSNIDTLATQCLERYAGAAALCSLATGSASLSGVSAIVLLLGLIVQLWASTA
jgi:leishmanolysin